MTKEEQEKSTKQPSGDLKKKPPLLARVIMKGLNNMPPLPDNPIVKKWLDYEEKVYKKKPEESGAKEQSGGEIEEKQNKKVIPEGLVKCSVCGMYKGRCKEKDLAPWPDPSAFLEDPKVKAITKEYYDKEQERIQKEDRYISVSCICDGTLCSRCKKNKVPKSGSNIYYPENNTFSHVPWFGGIMPCSECRNKEGKSG